MDRRNILFSGIALVAAPSLIGFNLMAHATGIADPNRLNQDLTPLGGERAASKSGLVPAWTGGATTPPAGWSVGMKPPDLFPNQKPIFSVTEANMDQYAAMLVEGQARLLKRYGNQGYRIDVYPSQRTGCAPQYIYDNTFKNVTRASPAPGGIVRGFKGAVGGVPFPILSDDPNIAGPQAIWNHQTRWDGFCYYTTLLDYVIGNNQRTLTSAQNFWYRVKYYDPQVTPESFNFSGDYVNTYLEYTAPPNLVGGKFQSGYTLQPNKYPNSSYEYLVGEGRIREAPEAQYDTPITQLGDAINFDESNLFGGALDRYTWKLGGKKEMIVPYNQHAMLMAQPEELLGYQFLNPDLVRHEVHRCWVVEAHLAPGARMTSPFRRFYLDEDTWTIVASDLYDDQGNYWRFANNHKLAHPALPGAPTIGASYYNLQAEEYVVDLPFYNAPFPGGGNLTFDPIPPSRFDPQSMANSGGL